MVTTQVWEQGCKGLNELANSPYYAGVFRNTNSPFFTRSILNHARQHSRRF